MLRHRSGVHPATSALLQSHLLDKSCRWRTHRCRCRGPCCGHRPAPGPASTAMLRYQLGPHPAISALLRHCPTQHPATSAVLRAAAGPSPVGCARHAGPDQQLRAEAASPGPVAASRRTPSTSSVMLRCRRGLHPATSALLRAATQTSPSRTGLTRHHPHCTQQTSGKSRPPDPHNRSDSACCSQPRLTPLTEKRTQPERNPNADPWPVARGPCPWPVPVPVARARGPCPCPWPVPVTPWPVAP